MHIQFMGHAALRLVGDTESAATLIDPWFSRTGAFFRSWFQFPENHHLLDEALQETHDILISHNHEDHFDPPVLRRALASNEALTLHIARFKTPWFRHRMEHFLGPLGSRLVEHEAFEEFTLASGIRAFFVPEESPGQIDAAIVLRDDNHFFVNMNDARLNTPQLERIAALTSEVDVLALQASGASEYPVNYLYDPEDMQRRKREKRQLKFEHCERVIDIFQPARILFFAGPPMFLDPVLQCHNDLSEASVFPDQKDILSHYDRERPDISERAWFLLPGDHLDDRFLWRDTDMNKERCRPFADKVSYIEACRQRHSEELDFDRGTMPAHEDMLRHFNSMARISSYVASRIGGRITFVIESEEESTSFTVDFDSQQASPGSSEDVLYVLTAPARALQEVLANEATWDDIFLSLRMTFDERSERFVSHFKTLLKYMDRDMMEALEIYEQGFLGNDVEWADFSCGGRTHRVQRFCPHAGVDLLKQGKVNEQDGTITCMAHRFCFDLETGQCVNVAGFRLLRPED